MTKIKENLIWFIRELYNKNLIKSEFELRSINNTIDILCKFLESHLPDVQTIEVITPDLLIKFLVYLKTNTTYKSFLSVHRDNINKLFGTKFDSRDTALFKYDSSSGTISVKPVVDHKGNLYKSFSEMCKHYNLNRSTLRCRLNRGIGLKDALENPIGEVKNVENSFQVNLQIIDNNIENTSTKKVQEIYLVNEDYTKTKCIKDHLGNSFLSVNAMGRYWNISGKDLRRRFELNWDLKSALETPVRRCISKTRSFKDHKGNTFPTIKDMVVFWGIDMELYNNRKRNGWNLKRILETPGV